NLLSHLIDRGALPDSGVADQKIDTTKPLNSRVDQSLSFVGARNVRAHGDCFCSLLAGRANGRGCRGLVVHVINDDAYAEPGEAINRGPPNPARTAGYDRNSTLQIQRFSTKVHRYFIGMLTLLISGF